MRISVYLVALLAALNSTGQTSAQEAPEISLYGITLDRPLDLPSCRYTSLADMKVYDEINNPVVCALDSFTLPGRDFGGVWKDVYFPSGHRPSLLAVDHIGVWLKGGAVQQIMVLTGGISDQDRALEELSQKFGRPATQSSTPVQNMMGAEFTVAHAVWKLGSNTIRFDGSVGQLDSGEVEALTPEGAKMRMDEQARIKALSPKL